MEKNLPKFGRFKNVFSKLPQTNASIGRPPDVHLCFKQGYILGNHLVHTCISSKVEYQVATQLQPSTQMKVIIE
jgi:hypothetical protein